MNEASKRYDVKVEIPITVILETIFSDDNKDVETLCRWARKYGFVDFEDKYYKLQKDYNKQSFYVLLDKKERKQYDYENYLCEELDQYKNNWEELKKWLEDEIIINKTNQIEKPNYPEWYIKWNCYLNLLNKMKELEEDK